MKPIKSLLVLAILCVPALASAQGYYGRPNQGTTVPGGFHNRAGRIMFGIGGGLGFMNDNGNSIDCSNCDFKPLTGEADLHLGGMLTPRFGLMFEGQVNFQTVQAGVDVNRDSTLTQGAAMIAGQFWLLPQLWIKGGIGFAHLSVDDGVFQDDLGTGVAIMGAIGVELFSARNFALEAQGRLIEGTYDSASDHVTSGTIGLGLNWF